MERLPQEASDYAKNWLTKNHVELIFNTRVTEWNTDPDTATPNQSIKTNTNQTFKADIIYKCIGYSPNSELINITNKYEAIHVNSYLQVIFK